MMSRYSLDFVLHMLNASVFHVSFPFLLIPCLKLYRFSNESLAFILAAVFAAVLYSVKIAYWLHERSQRKGGKVDWEDEVVLITGGKEPILV